MLLIVLLNLQLWFDVVQGIEAVFVSLFYTHLLILSKLDSLGSTG